MSDKESELGQYRLFVYIGDVIHGFHFFSLSITDKYESGFIRYYLDGIHSKDNALLELFRSQEKTKMKISSSYINEKTGEIEALSNDIGNGIVHNIQVVGTTRNGFDYIPVLRVIILHEKEKR